MSGHLRGMTVSISRTQLCVFGVWLWLLCCPGVFGTAGADGNDGAETNDALRSNIVFWINDALQGEIEPISNSSPKQILTRLRDGVILCRLINKLSVVDGKSKVTYIKKVSSPVAALVNINNFLAGTKKYGLDQEYQFLAKLLWQMNFEKAQPIFNCLHHLGLLANSKGFVPLYTDELTSWAA
ncbi:transgelin [Aplysia californica]|uniref:Transgelin n=1 Tax=Aplysia californica TaxID=6500 RepID=A0ABM1A7E9_APLCA|nr:transgelin [Aplysia californica]